MRLKQFKSSKVLLLKIFIMQQKNRLNFNAFLRVTDLPCLLFLWKHGYILGFTCISSNVYTIFLKKQFKHFSIKFVERTLSKKECQLHKVGSVTKTPIIISKIGLQSTWNSNNHVGGFLLCSIS